MQNTVRRVYNYSAVDIISTRLSTQHLIGDKFTQPEEVVSHFGAVQAQDFPSAKWGIGLRLQNFKDSAVEKAFNEGKILRTHVMRPTWHFVLPSDIRWMLELTAPRVKAFMAHYNRKLELDEALFTKTNTVITKALEEHTYLTRQELKAALNSISITTDVQRLAHIIMEAELDQFICSGPRRGKQFTYALLEKRVPKVKKLDRSEALSRLAFTYFQSHGPAQLKDFAWWSGLSAKDAAEGLELVKNKLIQEIHDNKAYWFISQSKNIKTKPIAFLLSIFDEYIIAYKDRSDLSQDRYIEKLFTMGNFLNAVVIINGKVEGTWKRELKKDKVIIKPTFFRKLVAGEKDVLEQAAKDYGIFLGLEAVLL